MTTRGVTSPLDVAKLAYEIFSGRAGVRAWSALDKAERWHWRKAVDRFLIESGDPMEVVTVQQLQVGWWGVFDPLYGLEKVRAVDAYALGPNERDARVIGTSLESGTWPAIRLHVSDEATGGRYIVRFPQEPVLASPPLTEGQR